MQVPQFTSIYFGENFSGVSVLEIGEGESEAAYVILFPLPLSRSGVQTCQEDPPRSLLIGKTEGLFYINLSTP